MSHKCDDCGQVFETLSRLRLHDCSTDESTADETADNGSGAATDTTDIEPSDVEDRNPAPVDVEEIDLAISAVNRGNLNALHEAMAIYETQLSSAQKSDDTERYRGISRAYHEQLITVLDDTTLTHGWEFFEEFLDAYHPDTGDGFPHVTTILQNVTSRYLIRTRLSEGVDALPVTALNFFSSILDTIDEHGYDYITEGVHPYGWGIGHPEHSVADTIQQHASEDIFVVTAMLEHAFYADQHSAIDLLERLVHDESIQETLSYPAGEITETRQFLDAPAGAVTEFTPTIPRYWDWHDEFDYEFQLDDDVEQRIRDLVIEDGIDDDLPDDWEIADLTL